MASSQRNDIAFYSRYCMGRFILPAFTGEHHGQILEILREAAGRCTDKPVLFYVSDAELAFVWHFRRELEPIFRFLLPPERILEGLFNKVLFSRIAEEKGLPVPRTMTVTGGSVLNPRFAWNSFPCIVKPAFSQDWVWDTEEQWERYGPYKKALRRIDSREELLEFCHGLPSRAAGFVIQSYIDGGDDAIQSFHGYFNERSQCLGYFVGRKIRTYPPHTGGSAYIRTVQNDSLAQLSLGLLQLIGFRGIVKIDYKWDAQEGNYKILEINTRYNLWQLLGSHAGVNLAAIAYHHQVDTHLLPRMQYKPDVRLLYMKQDLRAFVAGYRKLGEWTTLSYVKSLFWRTTYRVFDPRDPIPFLHSIAGFLKRIMLRYIFGWFRPLSGSTARPSSLRTDAVPAQRRLHLPVPAEPLVQQNAKTLRGRFQEP
ncbi:MAG: hypothetical protein HYZ01_01265 [Ignavibacteriales bacterium]|nr:hypothetical protein [Ignavibacteriales bacterium]